MRCVGCCGPSGIPLHAAPCRPTAGLELRGLSRGGGHATIPCVGRSAGLDGREREAIAGIERCRAPAERLRADRSLMSAAGQVDAVRVVERGRPARIPRDAWLIGIRGSARLDGPMRAGSRLEPDHLPDVLLAEAVSSSDAVDLDPSGSARRLSYLEDRYRGLRSDDDNSRAAKGGRESAPLDPSGPRRGRVEPRWNARLNAEIEPAL